MRDRSNRPAVAGRAIDPMGKLPKILLVEDDPEISVLICRFMGENGLDIFAIENGKAIEKTIRDEKIELIILDLNLPGEDGLSICKRLRKVSKLPIIMLTAKSDEENRIIGLQAGADDYLGKPFNPRELLARIEAVWRRSSQPGNPAGPSAQAMTFAGWRLDLETGQLYNDEQVRVVLTGAEFNLLQVLCENAQKTLSRDDLLDLTQGREANLFERSIDILISRLRQKIERNPKDPELIRTIRSAGYRFTTQVTAVPRAKPDQD